MSLSLLLNNGLFVSFFQLSLYYDLLGPLWIKDKNTFLSGDLSQQSYDNYMGIRNDEDKVKARSVLKMCAPSTL